MENNKHNEAPRIVNISVWSTGIITAFAFALAFASWFSTSISTPISASTPSGTTAASACPTDKQIAINNYPGLEYSKTLTGGHQYFLGKTDGDFRCSLVCNDSGLTKDKFVSELLIGGQKANIVADGAAFKTGLDKITDKAKQQEYIDTTIVTSSIKTKCEGAAPGSTGGASVDYGPITRAGKAIAPIEENKTKEALETAMEAQKSMPAPVSDDDNGTGAAGASGATGASTGSAAVKKTGDISITFTGKVPGLTDESVHVYIAAGPNDKMITDQKTCNGYAMTDKNGNFTIDLVVSKEWAAMKDPTFYAYAASIKDEDLESISSSSVTKLVDGAKAKVNLPALSANEKSDFDNFTKTTGITPEIAQKCFNTGVAVAGVAGTSQSEDKIIMNKDGMVQVRFKGVLMNDKQISKRGAVCIHFDGQSGCSRVSLNDANRRLIKNLKLGEFELPTTLKSEVVATEDELKKTEGDIYIFAEDSGGMFAKTRNNMFRISLSDFFSLATVQGDEYVYDLGNVVMSTDDEASRAPQPNIEQLPTFTTKSLDNYFTGINNGKKCYYSTVTANIRSDKTGGTPAFREIDYYKPKPETKAATDVTE